MFDSAVLSQSLLRQKGSPSDLTTHKSSSGREEEETLTQPERCAGSSWHARASVAMCLGTASCSSENFQAVMIAAAATAHGE